MTARQLVHRGTVRAEAWWVSTAGPHGEEAARARVIALYRPGVRVHHGKDGYLVVLPSPVTVRADAAPAAPLVRIGETLSAAPLTKKEREHLGAVPLLRVVGGAFVTEPPGPLVDPATWVTVHVRVAAVVPLGDPPVVDVSVAPLAVDARSALQVSSEAAQVKAAMAVAKNADPPWWARWLHRAAMWLSAKVPKPAVPTSDAPRGALRTALDRFERWAAGVVAWTGLQAVLDHAHAQYLDDLLRRFDSGDIDEALKRAIPLNDKPASGGGPALPQWLPPTPRTSLDFKRAGTGPGRAIGLGTDLFELLRETYRRAADKLAREGRYDEAAYVLAELLGSVPEALALLEKHERWPAAAALAEAKEQAPGVIIRLWFLAKDVDRAVQIARRTNGWADAVQRVEARDKAQGAVLRVEWANTLAAAGDLVQAIDVVWARPELRGHAHPWLRAVIEHGGPAAAEAWVKRIEHEDNAAVGAHAWLLRQADAPTSEARAARVAFYERALRVLHGVNADEPRQRLASAALRAALRDHGEGGVAKSTVERLASAAHDIVLAADLPAITEPPARPPLAHRADTVIVRAPQDAASAWPIVDAVALPDGRVLVAHGEGGASLLASDGRALVRYEQPAHAIVVNPAATAALLVASRGRTLRSVRVDLVTRAASRPAEVPFARFAPTFDGDGWWVGSDDELALLDAHQPRIQWRVNQLGADIDRITFGGDHVTALLRRTNAEGAVEAELWRFDTHPPTLRKRTTLGDRGVTGAWHELVASLNPVPQGTAILVDHRPSIVLPDAFPVGRPTLGNGWCSVPLQQPDGTGRVDLVSVQSKDVKRVLSVHLRGVPTVHRVLGDTLVVASNAGEVGIYDLSRTAIRRWVRMRA